MTRSQVESTRLQLLDKVAETKKAIGQQAHKELTEEMWLRGRLYGLREALKLVGE